MATKNSVISLSSILQDFSEAMSKEAEETDKKQEEQVEEPQEKEEVSGEQGVQDSVAALKAIADKAVDKAEKTAAVEAQEFGRLFATSFMDEMHKTAELQSISANAYGVTMQKLAQEQGLTEAEYEKIATEAYELGASLTVADEIDPSDLEKIAAEAYELTVAFTGSGDVEPNDMQKIAAEAYEMTAGLFAQPETLCSEDMQKIASDAYAATINAFQE